MAEIYVVCYNEHRAQDLFIKFCEKLKNLEVFCRVFKSTLRIDVNPLCHNIRRIRFMSERFYYETGQRGYHGRVVEGDEFERDMDKFIKYIVLEDET